MRFSLILMLSVASLLAAVGQILFKLGAIGASKICDFVNTKIIAGLFCYAFSSMLWIYCLSRAPLSTVYVFTALTFVLVYVFALIFLREQLNFFGFLGIALVLCGLYFVAVKGG